MEYRVADLARAAGTSVRNVRVYQDRGLLPPPRRQGRIGLYSEEHLSRLRLIGRLLARGYTFATIGELFEAATSGHDIAETLGLRAVLAAPWTQEQPIRRTRAQLDRQFGTELDDVLLARAVELDLVRPAGRDYLVPSPNLLEAGAEMVSAGVPLRVVLDLAGALRTDMETVAQRFFGVLTEHLVAPAEDVPATVPDSPAERILRLRPYAQRTVDALLAQAMQTQSEKLLERMGEAP